VRLYSVLAAALVTTLASPLAAQAQGIPEGAAHGAYVGYNTAGPVGWVVGGVVGGTVGGVEGLFGVGPGYGYWEGQPAYRRGYPTRHSYRPAPSLYRLSGFRLLRRVPLAAGMLGFGDRGIGPGHWCVAGCALLSL
jgi:hypothetical protein